MTTVDRPLTPRDVAARLGVSVRTVHRYIDAGHLPATNMSAGDKLPRWRINPADLDRFLAFLRDRPPSDAA